MLDLRRLRLLHELHARGTIAAVADALRFTPSAVSQQLSVLEREAGVALLEPAGRGVRLTDAAIVLVRHAEVLLERADLAEAELAAAAGGAAGRARVASFQSVAIRLAVPAMRALAREAPGLRCELVEAEPEQSLPALALGEFDLVLADEWQHQPRPRPAGVECQDLHLDPVQLDPARPTIPPRGAIPAPVPLRRAGRRTVGHRASRNGLGGDGRAHLPGARRLRSGHPPPDQRQRHQSRARGPRPGGDAATRARGPRDAARAWSCERSPGAPCTARSSPPPERRMRSGPPPGPARRGACRRRGSSGGAAASARWTRSRPRRARLCASSCASTSSGASWRTSSSWAMRSPGSIEKLSERSVFSSSTRTSPR